MQTFLDFLEKPVPPSEATKRYHKLNVPANPEDLADLAGLPESLITLYEKHDGIRLFAHQDSDKSAIYIAALDDWAILGEELLDAMSELKPKQIPTWIDDAIAFAEVPDSGDFFLLIAEGDLTGQVFYFNQAKKKFTQFAEDFAGFLKRICEDAQQIPKT